MENFDIVIQLIRSNRRVDLHNTEQCLKLMKEFLRREAMWARQLCLTDEIPFANLAIAISDISCSEPYSHEISKYSYSVAECKCCTSMLNWYGVMGESHLMKQGLPDPYQPLLQFFKLGGTFNREHRTFIQVNETALIQASVIQGGDLSEPFT